MANNVKKYILTAIILGSIAAVAGGAVALTNLLTEKKIKQNEDNKLIVGVQEIFHNERAKVNPDDEIKLSDYTYTVSYYEVKDENDTFIGYAFKSSGSNMYGKISLISGFDAVTHNFMSVSLLNNEQTYATTLVNKYVTPLNNNKRELDDVSCGATYGAKLVRDMVNEASEVANSLWK
jgi:Na+-translocating ferredoxin:NAD+ oxidoreductase RnfG subunit